jgi:hypothetical protein
MPPGKATTLAKSANRWFAGTTSGLYYSDDQAAHWYRHPFFGIRPIVCVRASGSRVFVCRYRPVEVDPPYNTYGYNELFVSTDEGQHFLLSKEIQAFQWHFGGDVSSAVVPKNDSTWCFLKWVTPQGAPPSTLFFTQNSGTSWDSIPIFGNTISGARDTITVSGIHGIRVRFSENDFSNPRTDTIQPIKNGLVQGNVFHWMGKDIVFDLYKRRLFTSTDNWVSWKSDSLLIPFIYNLDVIQFDSAFFMSGDYWVWRVRPDDPVLIAPVLSPGNFPPVPYGSYPLLFTNGKWLINSQFSLYASSDSGASWQFSGRGLTTGSTNILRFTGGRCVMNTASGIYILDPSGQNFTFHDSLSTSKNAPELFIIADSVLIGIKSNKLYRSADFGSHWDTAASNLSVTGIYQNGQRALAYGPNFIAVSSDKGLSWTKRDAPGLSPGSLPSNFQVFAFGDSILFLTKHNSSEVDRFFTTDGGLNWQSDVVPYFDDMYADSGRLFILNGILRRSDDLGQTWSLTGQVKPYPSYYSDVTYRDPYCVYYRNGLGLIHAGYGLWATGDEGAHWKVFPNLPFYNTHSAFYGPTYVDVQGAVQYRWIDNYLYAYAEGQGVWRIPSVSFRSQLPGLPLLAVQEPARGTIPEITVFPNPTQEAVWLNIKDGRAGPWKIEIVSPSGQTVLRTSISNTGPVDIRGLQNGLYFMLMEDESGRQIVQKLVVQKG